MTDYGNYCPIALTTDVLADRWTPLILRELVLGNTRFNDIARGMPGISRSLLVQRLKHLERKGVIETWPLPSGRGSEYRLTHAGADLEPVLMAMGRWAVRWLFDEIDPHGVDAVTLMWWMHRHIHPERLPDARVVVQFDHTAPTRTTLWVVLDRGDVSVCVQHPGFDSDVVVTTSTDTLAEVFAGYRSWSDAVASGDLVAAGSPRLVKAVPTWFRWSAFHDDVMARRRAS